MCASTRFKPVGGISSAAVVPSGASACGSPAEIAARAVELPLVEGLSSYEERVDSRDGIFRVEHRLTIALPAGYARDRFSAAECRRLAAVGTAAVIVTESGERLIAGWSEQFGSEQPLRLTGIAFTTGTSPRDVPAAILTFASIDGATAERIQNSEFKIQN